MRSCDLCIKRPVCYFCRCVDRLLIDHAVSIYGKEYSIATPKWREFIAQDCKEFDGYSIPDNASSEAKDNV